MSVPPSEVASGSAAGQGSAEAPPTHVPAAAPSPAKKPAKRAAKTAEPPLNVGDYIQATSIMPLEALNIDKDLSHGQVTTPPHLNCFGNRSE